ncbi:tetratricopeptide repeat protein 7A [Pelomyxa schiedti]|nr:tetratricopeptide repeat protein 7A [Pelomyxa schiedti]
MKQVSSKQKKLEQTIDLARSQKEWSKVSLLVKALSKEFPGTALEPLCLAELEVVSMKACLGKKKPETPQSPPLVSSPMQVPVHAQPGIESPQVRSSSLSVSVTVPVSQMLSTVSGTASIRARAARNAPALSSAVNSLNAATTTTPSTTTTTTTPTPTPTAATASSASGITSAAAAASSALSIITGEEVLSCAEKAEEQLKRVFSLAGEDNVEARLLLAKIKVATKHDDEAMELFLKFDNKLDPKVLPLREFVGVLKGLLWCADKLLTANKQQKAYDTYRLLLHHAEAVYPDLVLMPAACRKYTDKAWLCIVHLNLSQGKTVDAIQIIRKVLHAPANLLPETHIQFLASLVHTLLFKCTPALYPPLPESKTDYVPITLEEEVVLSLMMLEKMQSVAEQDASGIYDAYSIIYSRLQQYPYLIRAVEREISSRLVHTTHMWAQFFLSLIACGRYRSAIVVILECLAYEPEDVFLQSIATKVFLNYIEDPQKAIAHGNAGINICKEAPASPMLPRLHLMVGISYGKAALTATTCENKKALCAKALEQLHIAASMDPDDYQCIYYIALQLADIRQTDHSIASVRECLALNPNHTDSYALLALLLTSKHEFSAAMDVVNAGLLLSPTYLRLLVIKAKILETLGDIRGAINVYTSAIACSGNQNPKTQEAEDTLSLRSSTITDVANVEVRSARTELTFVPSTLDISQKDCGPEGFLWFSLATCFHRLSQHQDAQHCIKEAAKLTSSRSSLCDHTISMADVLAFEAELDTTPAKTLLYQKSLSVDPIHHNSLIAVAVQAMENGNPQIAEHYITTALRNNPESHIAWKYMGIVTQATNDCQKATQCFFTAMLLEDTAPLIPFSYFPRKLIEND